LFYRMIIQTCSTVPGLRPVLVIVVPAWVESGIAAPGGDALDEGIASKDAVRAAIAAIDNSCSRRLLVLVNLMYRSPRQT
jgi:hypothetical protein